jgi:hypothetical protein
MSIWHLIFETAHSDLMSLSVVVIPVLAVGWRLDRKSKTRADSQSDDHAVVKSLLCEVNSKMVTKEDFKVYVEQHDREHRYIEDQLIRR